MPAFDARALLGYTPLTVRLTTIHGTKVLRNLSQREVNRLISSWGELLDEQTPRVTFHVWEE